MDPILAGADVGFQALVFLLGVISWAAIILGTIAAVAAVYWIGERWWKR